METIPYSPFHQFLFLGVSPQKPLLQQISRLKWTQQIFLILALSLTLMLGFINSRQILQPVGELTRGMEMVWKGDFSYRISETRNDELGDLCEQYNSMAKALEEGKILKRMVSSQARKAIEEMFSSGRQMEGFRTNATVIFIGSLGTVNSLKELEPREFISALDFQIREICRIIAETGGVIDKLMGEKILVYYLHAWKNPVAAVESALTAVQRVYKAQLENRFSFPVCIGMNSGPVIVGFLGSENRRDHTIIGDTVNLAARSQSLAENIDDPRLFCPIQR